MAEWSIAAVLKTAFRASGTGVRIPPSPPAFARGEAESEGGRAESTAQAGRAQETDSASYGLASRKRFVNETTKILVWVVIAGALFGFLWWQGQLKRLATYVQQTREELKKCTWPTWDELKGSTVVVMISITLLGVFTFVMDHVLFFLFIKL